MSQSEQQFEEEHVIEWLRRNNWEVKHGSKEPFVGTKYDREKSEVIYWDILKKKVKEINGMTDEEYESVKSMLKKDLTHGQSLVESNRNAVRRLRSGGTYEIDESGEEYVIFDFDNIENNEFVAVNQFEFSDKDPYRNRRPDIVLFINGVPVNVVELKSVNSKNTTGEAINQITNTYEKEIPELFAPNVYNIVLNQSKIRYGAVGVDNEYYHYWKDNNQEIISDVESHFLDLTKPSRILEILKHYTFFKEISGAQKYAKIIPRHQQYFSTKEIIKDIRSSEDASELAKHLIVHVQGSGKSYAMMYAANILSKRYNYPVYIIVDESELVRQFGSELKRIEEINETIIDSDKGTKSGSSQLEEEIKSGDSGVILSILHLFNELDESVQLDCKPVVLADEAHRFLGDVLGSKMESVLEPFHYYGYTGTPIEETYEMFSNEDDPYIHRYSMADGVDEDAVLPVNMVSKKNKINWTVDEDAMDRDFQEEFEHFSEAKKRQIIHEVMGTEKIAGIDSRMKIVVNDIVEHFTTELRNNGIDYKGMVVTKGKSNAAKYGTMLQEKLGEDSVDVIYSSENGDSDMIQKFHKDDKERNDVIDDFKEKTNPKMLVVCDMLRTGFDAPILKTIYLDRRFSGGHTLLQTIARTNRPYSIDKSGGERFEKMYGEIIDYQGITQEFENLVEYDNKEIEKFTSEDKERFKSEFESQLTTLNDYFNQDFVGESDHDKKKWAADLSSNEAQKNFIRDFRRLRNLYQNIKPDPYIQENDEEYNWYESIYNSVRTHRKGIEEEVEDAMVDIVKSNVDVNVTDNPQIEQNLFDGNKEDDPLTIIQKKQTLEDILRINGKFDPRYEKLSERVEDIITKWGQDILDDKEVSETLDEIKKRSDKYKFEIQNTELTTRQYTIKSIILESYKQSSELDSLATSLVETYDSSKPSIRDWWNNESKLDMVRLEIDYLFYDEGYFELADDDELTSKILKKLISLDRE